MEWIVGKTANIMKFMYLVFFSNWMAIIAFEI